MQFVSKMISMMALAAAAAGQQPSIDTEDGNIHLRVPRDGGDIRFTRQISSSVGDITDRLDSIENTMATSSALQEATLAMQSTAFTAAQTAFIETNRRTDDLRDALTSGLADVRATVDGLSEGLTDQVNLMTAQISTLQSQIAAQGNAANQLASSVNTISSTVNTISSTVGTVSSVVSTLTAAGGLIDRANKTYLADPNIPVFRWQSFHTHQHRISWIDENRVTGFGGVNPSTWTDGNARAYQMNAQFRYIQRLFVRKGTASTFGATICSEVYSQFSSTDGKLCGAVFRIKNSQASTINWSPAIGMTSYSGWSEYASASVNGANTWGSACPTNNECFNTLTLPIPGAANGGRTSTVIFISTASYQYGVSSWNERATILMFRDNALALPSGLTYEDDLDTVDGLSSWKV